MNTLEKNKNIPLLIKQIALRGTVSPAEAIGVLEMAKDNIIKTYSDENN